MTDERSKADQRDGKVQAGRGAEWDQLDVLNDKDDVTEKARGLQVWGDTSEVPSSTAQVGEASEGTAERSARITEGQLKAEAARKRGLDKE